MLIRLFSESLRSAVRYGGLVQLAGLLIGYLLLATPGQAQYWTPRTTPADIEWSSVTYGNGLFVAVAATGDGNQVMTSPDGVAWTLRRAAGSLTYRAVTYGNGLFVALASNLSSDGGEQYLVMTSPDGLTWTQHPTAYAPRIENSLDSVPVFGWRGVTYGNGLFVAVGAPQNNPTGQLQPERIMTSPDGVTWTVRTSNNLSFQGHYWRSVTYGNGRFVAVAGSKLSAGGRAMTSTDGITWTVGTTPADNQWTSVTYGNGLFVAVSATGSGNRVMTSPDGLSWTLRTTPANNGWQGVTYGDGLFVAVANTGSPNQSMISRDGITWTLQDLPNQNGYSAVTFANGQFVAVASSSGASGATGSGQRAMTASVASLTGDPTVILSQPVAGTGVCSGATVTAQVSVTTLNPPLAYQWYRSGGAPLSGQTSPLLSLPNVQAGDAGRYYVRITAGNGVSINSTEFTLSVVARPSLSLVTSGSLSSATPRVTLTASGGNLYQFGPGATPVGNGPSATVSTPGLYYVLGTDTNGCSNVVSVSVTQAPSPDLSPLLYVRPTGLYGSSPVTVVVDVVELNGVASQGALTLRISQQAGLSLSLPPTETNVGGRSVTNSAWQLSGPSGGYYTLTTSQSVSAGDKLSAGLRGSYSGSGSSGGLTVSATIAGGGDGNLLNNTDADKVEYFQQ
ncbi:exo-alpha-sialidase [Spirosoma validum]|uniref:Exo-alpha-sialidase n=1 Tax=Spirosoma validum TaxID=2771355 RepID=A0A927B9K4_9BACT|nr:exo-alpha-sialidase [Spirosoma validum]MBD2757681.1 exo-alpha-sialidase [Spirosoma validum]